MPKRKEYIASPQHWKDMYTNPAYNGTWKSIDKVPLNKIKIDKSKMAYQNEIDDGTVLNILTSFELNAWVPILVNEDYCLLDGQHRLKAAKQMCLKYIDVIVENSIS